MSKQFGKVDKEVMHDPNLSLKAKGLYALLATWANTERVCFPSISTLMEKTGSSRSTVHRLIKELEVKGYVEREKRTFKIR